MCKWQTFIFMSLNLFEPNITKIFAYSFLVNQRRWISDDSITNYVINSNFFGRCQTFISKGLVKIGWFFSPPDCILRWFVTVRSFHSPAFVWFHSSRETLEQTLQLCRFCVLMLLCLKDVNHRQLQYDQSSSLALIIPDLYILECFYFGKQEKIIY